jgi:TfoX N-terminal domain
MHDRGHVWITSAPTASALSLRCSRPATAGLASLPPRVNSNLDRAKELMAYDEKLAQRIREALAGSAAITEKKMFGGIAFLHRGLMFVGVSDSSLMARVGKANHADSLSRKHVREMDFTGKPMQESRQKNYCAFGSSVASSSWPPCLPKARSESLVGGSSCRP